MPKFPNLGYHKCPAGKLRWCTDLSCRREGVCFELERGSISEASSSKASLLRVDRLGIELTEAQQKLLDKTQRKRYRVLEKSGFRCMYCGVNTGPFEVEHVVPKKHGGGNNLGNLVASCPSCNRDKGDRTPEIWAFDRGLKARTGR